MVPARVILICLLCCFALSVKAEQRDPTRPPNFSFVETIPQENLVLNGIIISNCSRVAIINGSIRRIGEQFLGNKVVWINSNSVHLRGVNGKITLFLLKSAIKFPPNTCYRRFRREILKQKGNTLL